MSAMEHPIWDILRGAAPLAPCSELLGLTVIEVAPEGGRVKFQYQPTAAMCNPMGIIQGGFVTAMLDDVMAPALISTCAPDTFTPTLEIKTTFIKGVRPGSVIAEGWIVKKTRSVAFMAAEITSTDGELLATASATFRIII
ncbi:MAG: phenylacetic acid degradation protein [Cellvibrionales bacterium]|nr:MAG: phenylacetic acid degradation protein [Cellvibrionales bacterium]